VRWAIEHIPINWGEARDVFWTLPVVGETYSGFLNDIRGFHVKPEHVYNALETAQHGPVQEGNVGGGTPMMCHEFKGGIGTASRLVEIEGVTYTLGVLVQANYGERADLQIAGVPVGKEITDLIPEIGFKPNDSSKSSILTVIATDAPLLPHQLKRLVKRAPLGIGRVGGMGDNDSGDLLIAFSTANAAVPADKVVWQAEYLRNAYQTPLFHAVVQAVEEAVVNALVAAETMKGVDDHIIYALPHDRLQQVLKKYNRLIE
jgi:D-aminopeptidase